MNKFCLYILLLSSTFFSQLNAFAATCKLKITENYQESGLDLVRREGYQPFLRAYSRSGKIIQVIESGKVVFDSLVPHSYNSAADRAVLSREAFKYLSDRSWRQGPQGTCYLSRADRETVRIASSYCGECKDWYAAESQIDRQQNRSQQKSRERKRSAN